MELTDMVMCDLHLGVHLGLNDSGNFNFSPHTMESSSMTSASSSCTPSDYGPFTPTSGRSTSTRSNSMDFGSSFDTSSSYPFDLTPPSSAVSASFSMGSSFASDGSEFLLSNMPVTPTRNRVSSEFSNISPGGCSNQSQITPQVMSMYPFPDESLSSVFTPTPGYNNNNNNNNNNNWVPSMWLQTESPVDFRQFPTPPKGPDRPLNKVKQSSVALQKAQKGTANGPNRARSTRPRVKNEGGDVKRNSGDRKLPVVPVVHSNRHHCDWEGCGAKFRRNEHLKRHIQGKHLGQLHPCKLCHELFDRSDNMKTHLKRHVAPASSNPRVFVLEDSEAREEILRELENQKGRRQSTKRIKSKDIRTARVKGEGIKVETLKIEPE